ncbi:MAG: M48 family metallopeptidase [Acidimicrobiia bacterium]|nr:M48 family metallopeptidase [Acidimicrobiia bacterium]
MVPELSSITHGDSTIEIEIQRSSRRTKTVEVIVTSAGVQVKAPQNAPLSALHRIVRTRATWILDKMTHMQDTERAGPGLGQKMPYLGRSLPVDYERCDSSPLVRIECDGTRFKVTIPQKTEPGSIMSQIDQAFVAWYNARAWEKIPLTVDTWWPLMGYGRKGRVLIRDQKRRWGSCAKDGTLRFNWRAIMLDQKLIDYVVVHELAHLRIRGHQPDFWNLVARALPNVKDLQDEISKAVPRLPLWN